LSQPTPGWQLTADGQRIRREWRVKDFVTALDFVHRTGAIAETEDHHPDLHLVGYRNVAVELWTHAVNGLTENDFILAARINGVPVEEKKRGRESLIKTPDPFSSPPFLLPNDSDLPTALLFTNATICGLAKPRRRFHPPQDVALSVRTDQCSTRWNIYSKAHWGVSTQRASRSQQKCSHPRSLHPNQIAVFATTSSTSGDTHQDPFPEPW
jgi:4a-hydroxytetrahydrobiopterin dehydratase